MTTKAPLGSAQNPIPITEAEYHEYQRTGKLPDSALARMRAAGFMSPNAGVEVTREDLIRESAPRATAPDFYATAPDFSRAGQDDVPDPFAYMGRATLAAGKFIGPADRKELEKVMRAMIGGIAALSKLGDLAGITNLMMSTLEEVFRTGFVIGVDEALRGKV